LNLVFDLDGTLIDVSRRHHSVYTKVISEIGGIPLPYSEYWEMKKSKVRIEDILQKSSVSKNLVSDFSNKFQELIESPSYLELDQLFPFSLPTLEKLSRDYQLFLISFRFSKEECIKELMQLKLDSFFEKIEISKNGKDPIITKTEILKRFNDSNSTIMIGDTEADILSAKNLGIISVAVLSGIRNLEKLKQLTPSYIIKNISFLPKILSKIGKVVK
jgi:phosphoglycolate phosphatase